MFSMKMQFFLYLWGPWENSGPENEISLGGCGGDVVLMLVFYLGGGGGTNERPPKNAGPTIFLEPGWLSYESFLTFLEGWLLGMGSSEGTFG